MRFVQTTGGRTGLPAPRRVRRRPFVQWQAPLVWTTLSLTLHADGRAEYSVTGASRFPRHWIYDADGRLAHKSGLTDYADWSRMSFGRHTPWGDEDSPALVTAVETALEQTLSVQLMHGGARPRISQLEPGAELVRQGDPASDIYLVLDGVIRVERDGEPAGRVRARGPARRAGPAGGRHQDLHARRGHPVPGRLGPRRAARPVRPRRAGHRAPARRGRARLSVRIHLCGVRGSTPAPGAEFVRYGGHTSCVAIAQPTAPRGAARSILDAGTGMRRVTGLLGGAPFAGTILLTHLHWDHVHGLPFFAAGDRDDARVTLLLPEQEATAGRQLRRRCWPGDVAAALPDHAGRPARRVVLRHAGRPARSRPRASTVEARRSRTRAAAPSATGSATAARPSPTSPTTAPPRSARVPTAGASTTRPRSPWPRASTC